jgi:putative phosphonate metabolism protein
MTARYAIYYAPPAATPLWDKASAWLGRDAYADRACERPAFPSLSDLDLDALTTDPRGYGFHATLKAPFELASARSETELLAAVRGFAAGRSPFEAAIAPAALGRFLAFQLQDACPQMDALHAACVRELDAFRQPLSDFDLARRRKARLTPQQDERLIAWGYPYVFDEFRFHMTLTGQIRDDGERERVLEVLRRHFAAETGAHRFDGVTVFKQTTRDQPFVILERAAFASAAPLRA